MKWNLIQTKVLAALLVCLIVGVAGIVALMNYNFASNSAALAAESVSGAERLFQILEAREVSKMAAVSETLLANPEVSRALEVKDRGRLSALTAPLYPGLKKEGITNWMFHSSTRVVGGDYVTGIPVGSDDEVGQLETLLEQFRRVFVEVLSHVPELQEQ